METEDAVKAGFVLAFVGATSAAVVAIPGFLAIYAIGVGGVLVYKAVEAIIE